VGWPTLSIVTSGPRGNRIICSRTLTKAYMLFLARWARRLSWKETAEAFRTSWDKVFDALEHSHSTHDSVCRLVSWHIAG
jgi:hypothetical protein